MEIPKELEGYLLLTVQRSVGYDFGKRERTNHNVTQPFNEQNKVDLFSLRFGSGMLQFLIPATSRLLIEAMERDTEEALLGKTREFKYPERFLKMGLALIVDISTTVADSYLNNYLGFLTAKFFTNSIIHMGIDTLGYVQSRGNHFRSFSS